MEFNVSSTQYTKKIAIYHFLNQYTVELFFLDKLLMNRRY